MTTLHIIILACVQGLAELLPVSSSAHVILAEKWLGLDPTSPDMTLMLVMLNPLFFLVTFADIKVRLNRWASAFGAILLPVFHYLDTATSLLFTALVGGTLAYVLQRWLDQRQAQTETRE